MGTRLVFGDKPQIETAGLRRRVRGHLQGLEATSALHFFGFLTYLSEDWAVNLRFKRVQQEGYYLNPSHLCHLCLSVYNLYMYSVGEA